MSSTGALSSDSSQDAAAAISANISDDTSNSAVLKQVHTSLSKGCPVPSSSLACGMEGMLADIPSKIDSFQKRRSSSRSIKRKKFDDELVESSLIKSSRNRPPSGSILGIGTSGFGSSLTSPLTLGGNSEHIYTEIPSTTFTEKKKTSKSAPKRLKKSKNSQSIVTKDLGRWKPADDLALIFAVQQTNDLETVHRGVKFSCKFTLQEVQERWYALLYDPVISKVAVSAMKQLHPDIIAQVQAKTLFGREEEGLLGSIASSSQPTVETFQELINKHPDVFLPTRTAKALLTHWNLMKQYHLLPDQTVSAFPKASTTVLNFSDAEEMIDDDELMEPADEALEHELSIADRYAKRDVRQLENELPKWQVLVDSITGVSPADFDNQTLAVLRGRLVRYLMRSREITLGRATKDNNVDVDLSLEGPSWKISRRQGIIKLQNGDFYIGNEGKRPVFVDGKPVLTGNKYKLDNNSVVEVVGLRFIFLINQDLIAAIRAEAAKNTS